MTKNHYIYRITNQKNGKVYIGQTKNLRDREYSHKTSSTNKHLRNAILLDGWGNFAFEVIVTIILPCTCKIIHKSNSGSFKKGHPSHNKGKKLGPAWNKGKTKELSQSQISEINLLLEKKLSYRKISKMLGINRYLISRTIKKLK